jgi:hypothetical protein
MFMLPRIWASLMGVLTTFWMNDTQIAFQQLLIARVTMSLLKTFCCFSVTLNTINFLLVLQRNFFADKGI